MREFHVLYRKKLIRGNTMTKKINKDTIIIDPNPVLRAKAKPVSFPMSDADKKTLLKMLQYVRDSQDDEVALANNLQPAVGIAAPQIGISKSMFAVSVYLPVGEDDFVLHEYALVNPKMISHSEKKAALASGEGCLSIKDEYEGLIPRYQRIKIKAYDLLQDKEVVLQFSNYLGIVVQHEMDHLKGVLFYDYIDKDNPWNETDIKIIE